MQGLCEWRDVIARAEDESTGFILPNKSLIEIGNFIVLLSFLCVYYKVDFFLTFFKHFFFFIKQNKCQ